jgi:hypothetical protein
MDSPSSYEFEDLLISPVDYLLKDISPVDYLLKDFFGNCQGGEEQKPKVKKFLKLNDDNKVDTHEECYEKEKPECSSIFKYLSYDLHSKIKIWSEKQEGKTSLLYYLSKKQCSDTDGGTVDGDEEPEDDENEEEETVDGDEEPEDDERGGQISAEISAKISAENKLKWGKGIKLEGTNRLTFYHDIPTSREEKGYEVRMVSRQKEGEKWYLISLREKKGGDGTSTSGRKTYDEDIVSKIDRICKIQSQSKWVHEISTLKLSQPDKDKNEKRGVTQTFIHLAAYVFQHDEGPRSDMRDTLLVKTMFDQGINPDSFAKKRNGTSILHIACAHRNKNVVKFCLEKCKKLPGWDKLETCWYYLPKGSYTPLHNVILHNKARVGDVRDVMDLMLEYMLMWEIMNNPEGKKVIVNRVNVKRLKCPELADLVLPAGTLEKKIKEFKHLPEPVRKGKISDVTVSEKGIISFMLTLESSEEAGRLKKEAEREKGKNYRVLPLTLNRWKDIEPNHWEDAVAENANRWKEPRERVRERVRKRRDHCKKKIEELKKIRCKKAEEITKILESREKNSAKKIAKLLGLDKFLEPMKLLPKPGDGKSTKKKTKRKEKRKPKSSKSEKTKKLRKIN